MEKLRSASAALSCSGGLPLWRSAAHALGLSGAWLTRRSATVALSDQQSAVGIQHSALGTWHTVPGSRLLAFPGLYRYYTTFRVLGARY